MNEYKFPFWKQPKLYNFFFDVADKYVAIRINIFGFDYGKYKICTICSSDFEDGDITSFIKENTRLKVMAFRTAFGRLEIDCY